MIRVGIIGAGQIAQKRHLPEYVQNKTVILDGIYDINHERACRLADQYGCKAYSSYEEMLKNPEIDAVSVCTANQFHAKISVQALSAEKHVLCEKPMAVTLEECVQMVKAAEENQKILMIGHNQRFTKAHRKAKQLIQEGAIGEIITFRTTFGHSGPETWSIDAGKNTWFFDKAKASMGVMADLGVHKTDLIQFLTQKRIVKTYCCLETLQKCRADGEKIDVDDNAVCIYTLEGNVVGTMTASWTYYGEEDNATVLYGTKGIMKLYDDPEYSIKITKQDGEQILYKMEGIQTNDNQSKSCVIDSFVKAITTGKNPESDGKSALETMKVIFANLESAKKDTGIWIDEWAENYFDYCQGKRG